MTLSSKTRWKCQFANLYFWCQQKPHLISFNIRYHFLTVSYISFTAIKPFIICLHLVPNDKKMITGKSKKCIGAVLKVTAPLLWQHIVYISYSLIFLQPTCISSIVSHRVFTYMYYYYYCLWMKPILQMVHMEMIYLALSHMRFRFLRWLCHE